MNSSSISTICFCSLCAIAAVSGSLHEPQQQQSTTATAILRRTLQTTTTANTSFVDLYEPVTNVDASALIDKDARAIFSKTRLGTHEAFEQAQKIYSQGAYAGSYASLTIDPSSLTDSVLQGTVVQGASGALGFVMETASPGNTTFLQVQYTMDCKVGGLESPVLDQCKICLYLVSRCAGCSCAFF